MKSTLACILILCASVCVSCDGGRKKGADAGSDADAVGVLAPVDKNGLVTIDINADYPKQEIVLQDIADVEYVPLAMSDKVLLSPSDRIFYLSDRYIMVSSRKADEICIFNRTGKIVSHFNRKGRGPGEYHSIRDIVFDEKAEEFFVSTIQPEPRILVYSLEGEHKRTLTLPGKWWVKVYNFDEHTLLVYDEYGTSFDNYSVTPYHVISKVDGSIVETLDIEMAQRYSNTSVLELTDQNGETSRLPVQLSTGGNKRYGGDELTIADISSDTLYHISRERVLTPVLVRTPSVHASEPKTVWSANLVTEDFIVFTVTTLDFNGAMTNGTYPIRSFMYNFKTGRVSDFGFINDNTSERWEAALYETCTPVNTAVNLLDPLRLVEAREKGELKGPLAEIAATLKEDDNPVVMIVKFK